MTGGKGGDGIQSDINGTLTFYGGGGGGKSEGYYGGDGGRGGGGKGYSSYQAVGTTPAQSGTPNTGGGGGGSPTGSLAGSGGSGVVIVRYKQLKICVNAQEPQCGTDYYHDGSDCVPCPAGNTRQPGARNECTPTSSGNNNNVPVPSPAKSEKDKAEETKSRMNAGITDPRQKKKADLLASAAIGGKKVNKLRFAQPVQADSADDACAFAYDKSGVRSSLGACVATHASSGRRLVSIQYEVELLFSSDEVDDTALTDAVNSLKANGVESTVMNVDPIEELKVVPGVDITELTAFQTEAAAAAEAEAAAAAAEVEAPPLSPPPPMNPPPRSLILDDDDHASAHQGFFLLLTMTTLSFLL